MVGGAPVTRQGASLHVEARSGGTPGLLASARMNRSFLTSLVALVGVVLTGCPTASSLSSARTLDKGTVEFTFAPTFLNGVSVRNEDGQATSSTVGVPTAEAHVRYGITDTVEIAGKLYFGGFAGHLKIGLLRPESGMDGFNLSIDPGLSYAGVGGAGAGIGVVYLYLPVLAGYRFDGHELTFGPRLVPVLAGVTIGGGTGSGMLVLGGGSLGLSLRLGESFRLHPEISILSPLNQNTAEGADAIAQLSLGFSFGKK